VTRASEYRIAGILVSVSSLLIASFFTQLYPLAQVHLAPTSENFLTLKHSRRYPDQTNSEEQ
jgi:hypothetical protein